ncbi:MAG: manganese efflux pump MntP family protein [Clostridiales bacterium]|nr:manganese efflux pump MntP family protein [Clostridiales bacterium]
MSNESFAIVPFIVNSVLLGVGLAMDAFSVSMANGLNAPKMSRRMKTLISLTFAAFQFLMPMIGWFCVRSVAEAFASFHRAVPWIALVLLLFIGGKMLVEGIRGGAEESGGSVLSFGALLVQGVATSIDALSVGFTIAEYRAAQAVAASLIIGGVTFVICSCGLHIGRRFGTKLAGKASILGGLILIGIGIEIFVTGIIGR